MPQRVVAVVAASPVDELLPAAFRVVAGSVGNIASSFEVVYVEHSPPYPHKYFKPIVYANEQTNSIFK
jgi:hypothetical protein